MIATSLIFLKIKGILIGNPLISLISNKINIFTKTKVTVVYFKASKHPTPGVES